MRGKKGIIQPRHTVPNDPQTNRDLPDADKSKSDGDWDDKYEVWNKKNTLYSSWYKTYAGHYKQSDEPSQKEQERQADAIRKMLARKRAVQGRKRLKAKDRVPTKGGVKLYEDFIAECRQQRIMPSVTTKEKKMDTWENAYRAAQVLEKDTWIIFMKDVVSTLI